MILLLCHDFSVVIQCIPICPHNLKANLFPIYLSIYLSTVSIYCIYLLYLSIYLSIVRSIYLSIYQSIYRSIYLPTYLPTSLSVYIPTYPKIYQSDMGDFIPPLGDKHQSSQAAFAAASHLGEILHGHSIATRA